MNLWTRPGCLCVQGRAFLLECTETLSQSLSPMGWTECPIILSVRVSAAAAEPLSIRARRVSLAQTQQGASSGHTGHPVSESGAVSGAQSSLHHGVTVLRTWKSAWELKNVPQGNREETGKSRMKFG